jgi:hypothetical protein
MEPRRLWRCYLVTVPVFLILALWAIAGRRAGAMPRPGSSAPLAPCSSIEGDPWNP